MLFIDDRQTERLEFDLLLEQRMCADHELHETVAEAGTQRASLGRRGRSGRFRQHDGMVK